MAADIKEAKASVDFLIIKARGNLKNCKRCPCNLVATMIKNTTQEARVAAQGSIGYSQLASKEMQWSGVFAFVVRQLGKL